MDGASRPLGTPAVTPEGAQDAGGRGQTQMNADQNNSETTGMMERSTNNQQHPEAS
jgi:hypothetical protein